MASAESVHQARLKSTQWVTSLFRKSKGDEELPEWYYKIFPKKSDPSPKSGIIKDEEKSESSPKKKEEILPQKPIKGPIIPQSAPCEGLNIKEEIFKGQLCKKKIATVTVGLEPSQASYEEEEQTTTTSNTISYESGGDGTNTWICRPEKPPKPKPFTKTTYIQVLLAKIEKRCKDAMKLLLEKAEAGLLPKTWAQKCEAYYQHGIDETPRSSTCSVPRSTTELKEDKKKNVHQQSLEESIMSFTEEEEIEYCTILDKNIEEYLKEPTAAYLLKKAGALDDLGRVVCELKDFYDVEHIVKEQLVEIARNCINLFFEHVVERERKEKVQKEMRKTLLTMEGSLKDVGRREQMFKVLQEELSECCPELVKKHGGTRKTKIFRGSVPMNIPTRGEKSLKREEIASEVVGKLLITLNRRSLFQDLDDDEEDEDLIELMPFFHHESFETDENASNAGKAIKPQKDWIQLESPVKAEFNTYKLPVDKSVSMLCSKNLEYSYKRARNFKETENMRKMEGLSDQQNLSKRERQTYLELKYYRHWVEMVRKRGVIRAYPPILEGDETLLAKSLWRGPYPLIALKRIRALKGMSKFEPKSSSNFYKGMRKVEAFMFEESKNVLEAAEKEAEEEEKVKKIFQKVPSEAEEEEDFTGEEEEGFEEDDEEEEEFEEGEDLASSSSSGDEEEGGESDEEEVEQVLSNVLSMTSVAFSKVSMKINENIDNEVEEVQEAE